METEGFNVADQYKCGYVFSFSWADSVLARVSFESVSSVWASMEVNSVGSQESAVTLCVDGVLTARGVAELFISRHVATATAEPLMRGHAVAC